MLRVSYKAICATKNAPPRKLSESLFGGAFCALGVIHQVAGGTLGCTARQGAAASLSCCVTGASSVDMS